MKYFEAVEETRPASLFLAGGITGCPDWQAEMVEWLRGTSLEIYNPRRARFDVSDPSQSDLQIRWEYKNLRRADAISFWFCEETLCPIVLFELGMYLGDRKPIFVGCHPRYSRREDVIIQSHLVRPNLEVVSSLGELAGQVLEWAGGD